MAELSLALLGLAGQLFTSIISTYAFLTTAAELDTAAPMLLWKLRIQEIRLRVWGRHWGFGKGKFDEFLNAEGLYDDVVGILRQLRAILDDAERLRSKYGIRQQQEQATTAVILSEGNKMGDRQKQGWKEKLRWAFTDKDKLEALINDLKDFNDGLHGLLRLGEMVALNRVTISEVLHTTVEPVDMVLIQGACSSSESPDTGRRNTQVYKDLNLAAKSKELFIKLNEQTLPPLGTSLPFMPRSSIHKPHACLQFHPSNSPSSLRIFGSYTPSPTTPSTTVLIEWKDFDPNSPYKLHITHRIDNLARLLSSENPKPPDFRVLTCTAYIEDSFHPRFGLLYTPPPNILPLPPTTLSTLLKRASNTLPPDLGNRFKLAQALAISLVRLHDCGWLHGGLRSSNIIFFHGAPGVSITEPYVIGFNYSRPTDPQEVTLDYSHSNLENDLYRHHSVACFLPLTEGSKARYRACHDLYSLGIVLLEIGLWERVGLLWKEHYTLERFARKLIEGYVPKLGAKCGGLYRDVVGRLLRMEVEDGEEGGGAWWGVVRNLEKCRA